MVTRNRIMFGTLRKVVKPEFGLEFDPDTQISFLVSARAIFISQHCISCLKYAQLKPSVSTETFVTCFIFLGKIFYFLLSCMIAAAYTMSINPTTTLNEGFTPSKKIIPPVIEPSTPSASIIAPNTITNKLPLNLIGFKTVN